MAEDWMSKVSKPEYRVKAEKDIFITARDGVRLAADIYRPDAKGKFPALLSVSPYGKDVQKLPSPRGPLSPVRGNGGQEAGENDIQPADRRVQPRRLVGCRFRFRTSEPGLAGTCPGSVHPWRIRARSTLAPPAA